MAKCEICAKSGVYCKSSRAFPIPYLERTVYIDDKPAMKSTPITECRIFKGDESVKKGVDKLKGQVENPPPPPMRITMNWP